MDWMGSVQDSERTGNRVWLKLGMARLGDLTYSCASWAGNQLLSSYKSHYRLHGIIQPRREKRTIVSFHIAGDVNLEQT
jgi:hypothetical protein